MEFLGALWVAGMAPESMAFITWRIFFLILPPSLSMLVDEVSNQLWWCWCSSCSLIRTDEVGVVTGDCPAAAAASSPAAGPPTSVRTSLESSPPSPNTSFFFFFLNLRLLLPDEESLLVVPLLSCGLAGAVRDSHA